MKNTIKKKRVFSRTAAFAIALTAVMVFGLVTCDSTPTGRPAVGSREYEARRRAAENRLANAQAELDAIVGAEISEAEAAAWEAESEAYFAALEAGRTEEQAAAEGERAAVAAVVATGQTQTQAAATVSQQRQRPQLPARHPQRFPAGSGAGNTRLGTKVSSQRGRDDNYHYQ